MPVRLLIIFSTLFITINVRAQHLIHKNLDVDQVLQIGETIFFSADSSQVTGQELWKKNGQDKIELVKDIIIGPSGSEPRDLFEFKGELFFFAGSGKGSTALWKSDGTSNGTIMMLDFESNFRKQNAFFIFKDRLYFQISREEDKVLFWSTDGTKEGIKSTSFTGSLSKMAFPRPNDTKFYFLDSFDRALWESDGTEENTKMLSNDFFIDEVYNVAGKALVKENGNMYLYTNGRLDLLGTFEGEMDHISIYGNSLYFVHRVDNNFEAYQEIIAINVDNAISTKYGRFYWLRGISNTKINGFSLFKDKVFFVASEDNRDKKLYYIDTKDNELHILRDVSDNYTIEDIPYSNEDYLVFETGGAIYAWNGNISEKYLEIDRDYFTLEEVIMARNEFFINLRNRKTWNHEVYSNKKVPLLKINDQPINQQEVINVGKVVEGASKEVQVTLENIGLRELTIFDIEALGKAYDLVGNPIEKISPGERKRVTISFTPNGAKDKNGILKVSSNSDHKTEVSISLLGTGGEKVPESDFEALKAIYRELYKEPTYPSFRFLNWDTTRNIVSNEWNGVFVNNNRVESLSLRGYNLSGELPKEIAGLTALKRLELGDNKITGSIPEEVIMMKNLEVLDLSGNFLSGEVSEAITEMESLSFLNINNNLLEGTIPEGLTTLKNLRSVQIANNTFSGLPKFDRTATSPFLSLNVAGNRLLFDDIIKNIDVFPFPERYQNQAKVGEDAFFNTNEGAVVLRVPDVLIDESKTYRWYKDDIEIDGQTGEVLELLIDDEVNGIYHCLVSDIRLSDFTISTTDYHVGPSVPEKEYNALIELYRATGGENWKYNDNWNTEENTVSGKWFGIEVKDGHVIRIDLNKKDQNGIITYGNDLKGQLPEVFDAFEFLEEINISNNIGLEGSLPKSFSEVPGLKKIILFGNSLIGNIPVEWGTMQNLEAISLSANKLEGEVPPFLTKMLNLKELYLGFNRFYGNLDDFFAETGNLERITLNSNQFGGALPDINDVDNNITLLYLSENNFEGTIPLSFTNLSKISQLVLSDNNLSGRVPEFMATFNVINDLRLDGNRFSGTLPDSFADISLRFFGRYNLSDNEISGIPLMRKNEGQSSTFFSLNMSNNKLDFSSIADNYKNFSQSINFYWQDSIGNASIQDIGDKDRIVIEVGNIKHIDDTYSWFKNGIKISEGRSNELIIEAPDISDIGTYICKVDNSNVPFSIYSKPKRLIYNSEAVTLRYHELVLSNNRFKEESALGETVADIVSKGEDITSINLTEGKGSENNDLFILADNRLLLNAQVSFDDYDLGEINIRLEVVYKDGEIIEKPFSLYVIKEKKSIDIDCSKKFLEIKERSLRSIIVDDSTIFAVGDLGTVLRSDDLGKSWNNVLRPDGRRIKKETMYGKYGSIYILTRGEELLMSENMGDTWEYIDLSSFDTRLGMVESSIDGSIYITTDNNYILHKEPERLGFSRLPTPGKATTIYENQDGEIFTIINEIVYKLEDNYRWIISSEASTTLRSRPTFFGQIGYALETNKSIVRTVDGGSTWTSIALSGNYSPSFGSLVFLSDSIYVGLGYNGLCLKTVDAGNTWENIVPTAYSFKSPGEINSYKGKIIYSGEVSERNHAIVTTEDIGENWTYLHLAPHEIEEVFLKNGKIAQAIGKVSTSGQERAFYFSENDGEIWLPQYFPEDTDFLDFESVTDSIVYILTNLGVLKSEDGLSIGYVVNFENNFKGNRLKFFGKELGFIWLSDRFLVRTTDGGNDWEVMNENFEYKWESIHFITPDEGYCLDYNDDILKTEDGGATWQIHEETYFQGLIKNFSFSKDKSINVFTDEKVFYKSRDIGTTWDSIPLDLFGINRYSPSLMDFSEEERRIAGLGFDIYDANGMTSDWKMIGRAPESIKRLINSSAGETIYSTENTIVRLTETIENEIYPSLGFGSKKVCLGKEEVYTLLGANSDQYHLDVTGGNIVKEEGFFRVIWDEPGDQTISILKNQSCGILTKGKEQTIEVIDIGDIEILGQDTISSLFDEYTYALAQGNYKDIRWDVENGNITMNQGDTIISVIWEAEGGRLTVNASVAGLECRISTEKNIFYERAAFIQGTVINALGQPVDSGISVLFNLQNGIFREIDRNLFDEGKNTFTFSDVDSGTYTIKIIPNREMNSNLLDTYLGNALILSEAGVLEIKNSGKEVTIELIEEISEEQGNINLRGRLVSSEEIDNGRIMRGMEMEGEPISDAFIYILNGDEVVSKDLTSSDGSFSFSGLSALEYLIKVDYGQYYFDEQRSRLSLLEDETEVDISVVLQDSIFNVYKMNSITSLGSVDITDNIYLHPNPVKDRLTLEATSTIGTTIIGLYDSTGKKLFTKEYLGGLTRFNINMEPFSNGIYLLRLESEKGTGIWKVVKE